MTSTTSSSATSARDRFRYEEDMVAVVKNSLARLAFGRDQAQAGSLRSVEVFTEVPAIHGVPDVAGVRFDVAAIERRRNAGLRALSSDVEVRAVMVLMRGPMSIRDFASALKMSRDYVRRAVVPLMVDLGWLVVEERTVRLVDRAEFVGKRVVTVEAKLRDWRGAIGQARRQQLSADAAYIAMPRHALAPIEDELGHLAADGIGVIAVDPHTRSARVVARPRPMAPDRSRVGRILVAERCLDMLDRGTREGQIYPVFGWLPPSERA